MYGFDTNVVFTSTAPEARVPSKATTLTRRTRRWVPSLTSRRSAHATGCDAVHDTAGPLLALKVPAVGQLEVQANWSVSPSGSTTTADRLTGSPTVGCTLET